MHLLTCFFWLFTSLGLIFVPNVYSTKDIIVNTTPLRLSQGGVMKVDVETAPGCRVQKLHFMGIDVPFKTNSRGGVIAIIGVGLDAKPGKEKILVKVKCNGIVKKVKHPIRIVAKSYPKEFLKVSKKMVSFPPSILKRVLADQKAVRQACWKIEKKILWQGPFIWPVKKVITSPFGLRRYFNNKPRSPHSGLDLRAKKNTPVKSPNNGRVVLVRDCYLSGNTVVIDHGGGLYTLYAHMNKVFVKKGQHVKKAQVIGLSGATGRITGPHLHWGVSLFRKRVDPAAFMAVFGK